MDGRTISGRISDRPNTTTHLCGVSWQYRRHPAGHWLNDLVAYGPRQREGQRRSFSISKWGLHWAFWMAAAQRGAYMGEPYDPTTVMEAYALFRQRYLMVAEPQHRHLADL